MAATTTASTAYASMVHPGKSTDDPSETTILVSVLTKTLTKNLQEYFWLKPQRESVKKKVLVHLRESE